MFVKWLAPSVAAVLALAGCTGTSDDDGVDTSLTVENFADRVVAAQHDAGTVRFERQNITDGKPSDSYGSVIITDASEGPLMSMIAEQPNLESADNEAGWDVVLREMEMRVIHGSVYIEALESGMWVDMTGRAPTDLTESDPGQQAAMLSEALVSVEAVGEPTELDGIDVQEYLLLVDTAEYFGGLD